MTTRSTWPLGRSRAPASTCGTTPLTGHLLRSSATTAPRLAVPRGQRPSSAPVGKLASSGRSAKGGPPGPPFRRSGALKADPHPADTYREGLEEPTLMMRILQTLRRRLNGEGGFTLVEAMVSITILAVGAFAVAQAMIFGLSTHRSVAPAALLPRGGRPADGRGPRAQLRQPRPVGRRRTSRTRPTQQPRLLGQPESHRPTTPTAPGRMAAEPIVRVAGASPALAALPEPVLERWRRPTRSTGTSRGTTRPRTGRVQATPRTATTTASATPTATTRSASRSSSSGRTASTGPELDAQRVVAVLRRTDHVQGSDRERGADGRRARRELDQRTRRSRSPRSRPTRTARSRACRGTSATARRERAHRSRTRTPRYGTYTIVNTVVDNGGSTASNSAAGCT